MDRPKGRLRAAHRAEEAPRQASEAQIAFEAPHGPWNRLPEDRPRHPRKCWIAGNGHTTRIDPAPKFYGHSWVWSFNRLVLSSRPVGVVVQSIAFGRHSLSIDNHFT